VDKPVQALRVKPVELLPAPPMDNAREARRVLEMLAAPPTQHAPRKRRDETIEVIE
jgi:hypothetical protein